MQRVTPHLLILLTAAIFIGASAAPALAELHKDEKLGYSVVYPNRWEKVPFGGGSDWEVQEFKSNIRTEWQVGNDWDYLTPSIMVVVIPRETAKRKDATVEKTDKGIKINRKLPYKNIKEYMEQYCKRIGGFYFDVDGEEAEVNGMKVLQYEAVVDKLVRGPRRVFGWEFQTEDALYGLVGQIFDKDDRKYRPDFLRCYHSFKTFPRTGSLPGAVVTGDEIVIKDAEKEKKKEYTEKELKEIRDNATQKTLVRLQDNLGKEWKVVKSKNFIAVTHSDMKYTKKLLMHAEALRAWLDKNLGFVGSGYVGQVVITICKDTHEDDAYRRARGWFSNNPEIVTYKDKEGWSDWAMETLNRNILRFWLRDKNRNLAWGAPVWISSGLSDFIEGAKSKGRKIEFAADTWESVQMKEIRRADKLLKARDFFTMTSDELWKDWGQTSNQVRAFLDFLLVGAGSRGKYKNVFSDYVKSLIFMLDEEAAKEALKKDKAESKEPTSEEEEDKMFRERQESWRKQEKERLQQLLVRTFEDWDDKDWEKFNSLYWRTLE